MCGIVGYVGNQPAAPFLIEGLTRLEYRGYDSAGVAVLSPKGGTRVRTEGRVRDLEAALPKKLSSAAGGGVGIGHTRWATHGPAVERNAHPHQSQDGRISVVHNGIIDNSTALRAQLESAGVEFTSDTDTEVIAHLIARSSADTLEGAVLDAAATIDGTYALAVIDEGRPDRIVVARHGSPLILGIGDGEMFVASDAAALVRHTSQVIHLEDGEFASVTERTFRTFTSEVDDTGRTPEDIGVSSEDLDRGEHQHFMLKEMLEQPEVAAAVLRGRLDPRFGTTRLNGLSLSPRGLRAFRRVKFLGCGSAYYVGQIGAQLVEELARIPADAEAASEFRYRNPIIEPDTLYVAVSQSGETADTAFAVEEIKRKGGHVVGVVNVVGSTIARAVDGGIYIHAGPEVAVASTKALTNMALAFGMLAVHLGRVRDLSVSDGERLITALQAIPGQIAQILSDTDSILAVARELAKASSAFYIGRTRGYPVAREGAQKLKEISYIHAEAYQASELKHGPLALIDEQMPTVAIVPDDELTDRNLAAVEQIQARGGPVVLITHPGVEVPNGPDGRPVPTIKVPKSEPELDPILLTIPTQLIAYHTALLLGHDIDKPRNLAKSVTVE